MTKYSYSTADFLKHQLKIFSVISVAPPFPCSLKFLASGEGQMGQLVLGYHLSIFVFAAAGLSFLIFLPECRTLRCPSICSHCISASAAPHLCEELWDPTATLDLTWENKQSLY
jgi:hypothetical protein